MSTCKRGFILWARWVNKLSREEGTLKSWRKLGGGVQGYIHIGYLQARVFKLSWIPPKQIQLLDCRLGRPSSLDLGRWGGCVGSRDSSRFWGSEAKLQRLLPAHHAGSAAGVLDIKGHCRSGSVRPLILPHSLRFHSSDKIKRDVTETDTVTSVSVCVDTTRHISLCRSAIHRMVLFPEK